MLPLGSLNSTKLEDFKPGLEPLALVTLQLLAERADLIPTNCLEQPIIVDSVVMLISKM